MNRRGFLKAFVGAAVGAALAPYVKPEPWVVRISDGPSWVGWTEPGSGKITYKMLEEAYVTLSQGSIAPDIGIMSRSQYNALRRLTDGHRSITFRRRPGDY